jgi:hypothetical protein
MNESIVRSQHDDNAMAQSQSSDVECGSVFSSSAYGRNDDDDEDSPPLLKRQATHSGENNRDFELIEREIGMCRPVRCQLSSLHRQAGITLSFSLKMVYAKYTS